jgi:predicted dehydrogenase
VGLGAAVHVVDPAPAARAAAEELGASSRPELGAAGADLAGVVVATPATDHAATLREVAALGVPVFCEKPLTVDGHDAEQVAAELGDRLHVMHVWRYHPGIEALGEIARSGSLGAVNGVRTTRANWTSPRTDVDSTWTLVPHDLTIGIEVLGRIPEPQAALAECIDGRVVGLWAHLGRRDEPWLVVEASNRSAERRREVRVHGTEGTAALLTAEAGEVVVARGHDRDPVLEAVPIDPTPALRRQLAAWLHHLDGGPPPKSDGAEGVAVVRAIEALRRLAGLDGPTAR